MKKIEAVVQTYRVRELKEALERIGIVSLTLEEVEGRGRQGGITEEWGDGLLRMDTLFKAKVEVVVSDERTEQAVETLQCFAKTGFTGDGKIFISPALDAVRVRTGEHGKKAV